MHSEKFLSESQTLQAVEPLVVQAFGRELHLTPVFAPIWDMDGRLIALEMLSRVQDRDTGALCSPEMFFSKSPQSEQFRIFCWQLDILSQLVKWSRIRDIPFSLNINRGQALSLLGDPYISGRLQTLAPLLRLEISERFINKDTVPDNDPILQGLRGLTTLWLDDFGAGATALSWLMTGFFEVVKIDRQLFRDLVLLQEGVSFFNSFSSLARALNARIVAEGIENTSLMHKALSAGMDYCQGFMWPEVSLDELSTTPIILPQKEGE
ncbi:EAL domain-containing protein [Enterobacter asburiae]|uniref:EAL domain-containing protein n=1 Tax=Enterobacter asburiae TaxID=61645 RepID=UPI003EE4C858